MRTVRLLLIFAVFFAFNPCFAQELKGRRVSVEGDILSIDVRGAPLFDILKEIAAETGMEVKVDPEVNKTVSASFENVPIDRGIARLIRPLDYVMKWKRITEGEESFEEITAVEIFRKGERDKARQVLSPSRGPEDFHREELERREMVDGARRRTSRPQIKKPRKRYKSSITKVDPSEPGGRSSGYSTSSGNVRIRKFEVIPDTDSYDELSP